MSKCVPRCVQRKSSVPSAWRLAARPSADWGLLIYSRRMRHGTLAGEGLVVEEERALEVPSSPRAGRGEKSEWQRACEDVPGGNSAEKRSTTVSGHLEPEVDTEFTREFRFASSTATRAGS